MSAFVLVTGEYIELDDAMIDGALNLMALKYGNHLDQETIRRFEQLKRMVAEKSKDESQGIKPRIKVTVPNKSRCEGSPKRKILKLDQPAASTSGAKPGPSSRAFGTQPSTSRVDPGPSSRAFGIQSSTSRDEPGPSSWASDQSASTSSRARTAPSSRAFGIQPSTSRVEPGPSSGASEQSASTSSAILDPSLPPRIQNLIGLCSMPIQKKITASDVLPSQCRLMLPRVPTEELIKHIELKPNENIKLGIRVTVYGPDGREYAMTFKAWEKSYVINTRSWIQFCQDYQLRKLIDMATLTIRMFRHRQTDDLCFAITM